MVKVSVVIPVYNVDEFLAECLDSIVNQTLEDIEIICINDGSTDKSPEILKFYAANDKRIKLLSQTNKGHAVATNRGIELAKGKYLYLMDSDDLLELNALEETYNHAEKTSADFVMFQSMNYVNDEDKYYKSEIYSMDKVADFIGNGTVNANDLGDLIFKIPVTPWSKLYRTDFVRKCGAIFPEGLIFDDNIFFWDVLFSAKRIAFLKKYFFTRRWYTYSSTTAGDLRFIDSIAINNLMIDRFKKYNVFDKFKKTLYNRKINLTYHRFDKIKSEFKQQYFEALHDDYKKIVDDGWYDDYMSVLYPRNKQILNACLDSQSSGEFIWAMSYWELQKAVSRKDDEIVNLNKNNENLQNQCNKLKKEIANLNDDLEASINKIQYLKGINDDLNKTILVYKNSKSWKLTEPLRKIKKFS
ncbi:MAG: glycosyltransferase family 2 protein [Methanobrevibacter thaueri]|nr:glycosyltransferase family 2 protein [Methanobrevibacter thaueri]